MTEAEGELALDMSGVSKRYGQTLVLDDVTFRVRHGSIHGLVGHNGAGKSTLMKIALGGVPPTTGSVSIGGKTLTFTRPAEARDAGVGMVLQELSLIPTLSVADNIFLNDERTGLLRTIRADSQRRAARDLLAELGLTSIRPSKVVADLSIAEQQMVEIAKALRLTRRLLILDEPTAPLSFREVQRLFQLVRRTAELGVGVVFITHHLREIFDICDEMTVLRGGKVVLATRPADTSLGQVVRAIVGTELAAVERRERRLPAATTERPPVLDVRGLSVEGKLQDLSFRVHPGEIVGVAGLAGSGRSVLLKTLFGDLRPSAGTLEVRGRSYTPTSPANAIAAGIYLIPEDRAVRGVISMHTIEQNAVLSILGRVSPAALYRPAAARAATETMIRALDVRTTRRAAAGLRAVGRQPAEGRAREVAARGPDALPARRADVRRGRLDGCLDHPPDARGGRRRRGRAVGLVGPGRAHRCLGPRAHPRRRRPEARDRPRRARVRRGRRPGGDPARGGPAARL